MKSPILVIGAAVSAICLCSCQSIKDVPITVAYKTDIARNDVTAAYSSKRGLTLYGEKRVRPQK